MRAVCESQRKARRNGFSNRCPTLKTTAWKGENSRRQNLWHPLHADTARSSSRYRSAVPRSRTGPTSEPIFLSPRFSGLPTLRPNQSSTLSGIASRLATNERAFFALCLRILLGCHIRNSGGLVLYDRPGLSTPSSSVFANSRVHLGAVASPQRHLRHILSLSRPVGCLSH